MVSSWAHQGFDLLKELCLVLEKSFGGGLLSLCAEDEVHSLVFEGLLGSVGDILSPKLC